MIRTDVCLAWPTAEIAVMGPKGAVSILYARQLAGTPAETRDAERARLEQEFQDRFNSPFVAASTGYIDDVIYPQRDAHPGRRRARVSERQAGPLAAQEAREYSVVTGRPDRPPKRKQSMVDVLWIAGVGATILFIAIGCLIGLMYLLTVPWLLPKDARPPRPGRRRKRRGRFRRRKGAELSAMADVTESVEPPTADVDEGEPERLRQAAALGVAIARAESERLPFLDADTAPEWRALHRAQHLGRTRPRRGGV